MPRPNHGPAGGQNYEKAKDFKGAIKRLFSELNTYKTLIVIAFTLAILGSVLSILAPNRLSDLTDEISAGLVINQNNMEILTKKATENLSEDKLTYSKVTGSLKLEWTCGVSYETVFSSSTAKFNLSVIRLSVFLLNLPNSIKFL